MHVFKVVYGVSKKVKILAVTLILLLFSLIEKFQKSKISKILFLAARVEKNAQKSKIRPKIENVAR